MQGIRAGISLSEFWSCTPYQYGLYLEAWHDDVLSHQQRDVSLAWNSANFTNAKRLPDLRGILNKMQPDKAMKAFTADKLAKIEAIKLRADSIG